jgi:hypothetical protein
VRTGASHNVARQRSTASSQDANDGEREGERKAEDATSTERLKHG